VVTVVYPGTQDIAVRLVTPGIVAFPVIRVCRVIAVILEHLAILVSADIVEYPVILALPDIRVTREYPDIVDTLVFLGIPVSVDAADCPDIQGQTVCQDAVGPLAIAEYPDILVLPGTPGLLDIVGTQASADIVVFLLILVIADRVVILEFLVIVE
jgi:hypothetical protein